jgi:hypothetical protein
MDSQKNLKKSQDGRSKFALAQALGVILHGSKVFESLRVLTN